MTLVNPALDALSYHLQNPLTQALMGVTFVFGLIRTRWYWVVILALMVAISSVLAEHSWSVKFNVAQKAGESGLRFFLANGTLMLASYLIGYSFKRLLLLISGEQSPPAEQKRILTNSKNANTIAIIGVAVAAGSFLWVNDWPSGSGLLSSRICIDNGGCFPYRWFLTLAAALVVWAAYLKFGRRHS